MIGHLPGFIVEALRRFRSAALRAVGPLERILRSRSEGDLPPLWLRLHAGPVKHFVSSAEQTASTIRELALLRPSDAVLDVGCGPGAMARELQTLLSPQGRYVGFDVHRESIDWCRKRFAADQRFTFELAEIRTPFSQRSAGRLEGFRFPASDEDCDLVLAKSVFTHMLEPETAHYLREISRVLRPGRAALVTAFLFDPELSQVSAFPFRSADERVRWRVRARPHAAVAYSRGLFESLARSAGLRIQHFIRGFYPGDSPKPFGQDVLVLSKT
jgi:ubiquinone/menaquinone biosynthesis C-methylase UbiE